ncbi:MAG TPA: DUF4251 domain-containing protein [Flavitalea sp.]|nr:DUF4251 domain-containing protein [Flavitalea sp.]
MKALQYRFLKGGLLLLVSLFSLTVLAQDSKNNKSEENANVKAMIDAKRYLFKAQSAHPTRGRVVQLNTEYDLKISPDTIQSYLPYYGRAYSAPIGESGGPMDFVSKDFEYSQKDRKKGGWDITIKPKDGKGVREMFLSVFENGSASLRVTSNNREPISYNGFIAEK